jgi:hypothetical protein
MERAMEDGLGRFGDRRLEKGGLVCWPALSASASVELVFGVLAEIELARSVSRVSFAIGG